MRARPLMPMPPMPTKWTRAGAGGSSDGTAPRSRRCAQPRDGRFAPRVTAAPGRAVAGLAQTTASDDRLPEALAPVELVAEEPERRAAGREQDDVARLRLAPRGRHGFGHPGKGSARRQTAAAQRRLQRRRRRSREEIDLRLMTRGGLRQWRRVESLVGAARQQVHLSRRRRQRVQRGDRRRPAQSRSCR